MRKREHVIPLRLNKKEMAYLEKQVAMSRMPREEYLRALVMGGEVRARPCTHHAEQMALVRDWYQKGYIMQDLVTYTGTNIDLLAAGNGFANITGQGGHPDYVATNASNQTGQPLEGKALGNAVINTNNVTNQPFCVASTSKHPEAALKFLNLTYCDADIANLIQWGIKDRDYVVNEDGTVEPPEGFDSASVPYPGGYMNYGNMYSGLEYPAVGTSQESVEFGVDKRHML